PFLADQFTPFERNINELRNAAPRRNLREAATPQHRGFECELGRDADADLLVGRDLTRLVIEDGMAAVAELLDAIGAAAQCESPLAERDFDFAGDLGVKRFEP